MDALVISTRKLLPAYDGGVMYTGGLMRYLKKLGFYTTYVSFFEDESYTKEEYDSLVKCIDEIYSCKLFFNCTALNFSVKYPNNIRKYTRKRMFNLLKMLGRKRRYDLVVIDHLHMFEYAKLFPDSRIVLHTQNVESNIWKEYATKTRGLVGMLVSRTAKMTFAYEKSAILKAESVTAISDGDVEAFQKLVPQKKVYLFHGYSALPVVKTSEDIKKVNNKILFIGSYSWYPNSTAADFLVNDLMPVLRTWKKGIQLYLVGKEPTEKMKQYAQKWDDIVVTGMVDSVDPYIKGCDIFINAVTEGSGLNIKMIEAMGKGIPVLSSEFGARGIKFIDEQDGFLYYDTASCAEKICYLLEHRDEMVRAAEHARKSYLEFVTPTKEIEKLFLGENHIKAQQYE